MSNKSSWIQTRVNLGWLFLALGAVVALAGGVMQWQFADLPFNTRIITGLGILLVGVGIAYLVRYRAALRDEGSARRITAEERDERVVLIRNQAGNRAFWVSIALVYAGLMWASFSDRGDLPPLTGDTLWFYLAGATVVPFVVYVASLLYDERDS